MGETTSHAVFGDKVRVYHRANSTLWQCATCFEGKEWRVGTKTDVFALAKEFAEGWHLELRGKSRDQLKTERTFADAAKQCPAHQRQAQSALFKIMST